MSAKRFEKRCLAFAGWRFFFYRVGENKLIALQIFVFQQIIVLC